MCTFTFLRVEFIEKVFRAYLALKKFRHTESPFALPLLLSFYSYELFRCESNVLVYLSVLPNGLFSSSLNVFPLSDFFHIFLFPFLGFFTVLKHPLSIYLSSFVQDFDSQAIHIDLLGAPYKIKPYIFQPSARPQPHLNAPEETFVINLEGKNDIRFV